MDGRHATLNSAFICEHASKHAHHQVCKSLTAYLHVVAAASVAHQCHKPLHLLMKPINNHSKAHNAVIEALLAPLMCCAPLQIAIVGSATSAWAQVGAAVALHAGFHLCYTPQTAC
jgi:hypothetical protein